MPYFNTNTCNYYYDQNGKGKTLIFAHGLFVDKTIFSHQFNYLSKDYNCISFDMPGHSKSSFNKNGWTLDKIADDFAQFIIENTTDRPILIGQSQGGMVFMRLAAKYPELVSGLILIGTSSKAEYKDRIPFWQNIISVLESKNQEEINKLLETVQQNVVSDHFLQNNSMAAKEELRVMQSHNSIGLKLATEAAVLHRTEYSGELNKINCKTIIICGEEDHATPLDISQMMADSIKKSQLEIIPNASHHIPIEEPEKLTAIISKFINDIE